MVMLVRIARLQSLLPLEIGETKQALGSEKNLPRSERHSVNNLGVESVPQG
jgi:hypothetical protein